MVVIAALRRCAASTGTRRTFSVGENMDG